MTATLTLDSALPGDTVLFGAAMSRRTAASAREVRPKQCASLVLCADLRHDRHTWRCTRSTWRYSPRRCLHTTRRPSEPRRLPSRHRSRASRMQRASESIAACTLSQYTAHTGHADRGRVQRDLEFSHGKRKRWSLLARRRARAAERRPGARREAGVHFASTAVYSLPAPHRTLLGAAHPSALHLAATLWTARAERTIRHLGAL